MFLGEIILESLGPGPICDALKPFEVMLRIENRPTEDPPLWHIARYRVPREALVPLLEPLSKAFARDGWYMHFFSEEGAELFVVLRDRVFFLPKHKEASWEEMIAYGESVGVARCWTETIPVAWPLS